MPDPPHASVAVVSDDLPERSSKRQPAFAQNWPQDPSLQELVDAFEQGNYHFVRQCTRRLARSSSDPHVVQAAQELRRRLDPDPLAAKLLIGAVALLTFLCVWAYHIAR